MTLLRRDWQWFIVAALVTNGLVVGAVLAVDWAMRRWP
jgi:hypothetical protein